MATGQESYGLVHSRPGGSAIVFGGVGVPDLLYGGFAIESQNLVLRGQVGGLVGILSAGVDVNIHFGNHSPRSFERCPEGFYRRPWYAGIGFLHLSEALDNGSDPDNVVRFYFGRDFNPTPRFGMQLEFGTGVILDYQESSSTFEFMVWEAPRWGPVLNFRMFYRLSIPKS